MISYTQFIKVVLLYSGLGAFTGMYSMVPQLQALKRIQITPALRFVTLSNLYSFIGWATYQTYGDYSLKTRKLYAKDFEKLGVHYIHNLEYDPSIHSHLKEVSDQINYSEQEKKWGKQASQGITTPVYVAHINNHVGFGTFADRDIQTGEVIDIYAGTFKSVFTMPSKNGAYAWQLSHYTAVDATDECNELRYVNHSYIRDNVEPKWVPIDEVLQVIYVAKKPILKDEQLFVNYTQYYWDGFGLEPQELTEKYRFWKAQDKLQEHIETKS